MIAARSVMSCSRAGTLRSGWMFAGLRLPDPSWRGIVTLWMVALGWTSTPSIGVRMAVERLAGDPALAAEAAWEERALDIRYRRQGGQVTERRIWPLSLGD